MANYEATKYAFDGQSLTGVTSVSTGTVLPWSDASLPTGFLECNGSAVSRSTYSALFAVIGTTYGSGNGSTTFNVPDLKDKCVMGRSNAKALASTGGAETVESTGNIGGNAASHTLSTPEISSHTHSGGNQGGGVVNCPTQIARRVTTSNTGGTGGGGGHSHNMSANFTGDSTSALQPYMAVIYIIKT
jgi:microcystin-dependent protein